MLQRQRRLQETKRPNPLHLSKKPKARTEQQSNSQSQGRRYRYQSCWIIFDPPLIRSPFLTPCHWKLLGIRVRGMRGGPIGEKVVILRPGMVPNGPVHKQGSPVTGIGMGFGPDASKVRLRLVIRSPCCMGIPLVQWAMRWYARQIDCEGIMLTPVQIRFSRMDDASLDSMKLVNSSAVN